MLIKLPQSQPKEQIGPEITGVCFQLEFSHPMPTPFLFLFRFLCSYKINLIEDKNVEPYKNMNKTFRFICSSSQIYQVIINIYIQSILNSKIGNSEMKTQISLHTKKQSSPSPEFINKSYESRYKKQGSNILTLNTSIPVLEQELRLLKQKQKRYNKLTVKLKEIQKNFTMISQKQQSDKITGQAQKDEIQKMKNEIDECITEARRVSNETIQIDKQIDQSGKQLNSLQLMLQSLRQQNRESRNQIKEKGLNYSQKQRQLQQIEKQRDQCEVDIQSIKQDVQKLVGEQYKLKKQAEIIEFKKLQQQLAINKYEQLVERLKRQSELMEGKIQQMSSTLKNEQQRYKNIRQQISFVSAEQNELIQQMRRRENQSKQNKQNLVRSQAKLEGILKQIKSVQHDMGFLTTEFSKQTDRLSEMECKNTELNEQFDAVCRDAKQVWESLRQTLDVAANNEDVWGLENIMKIRMQALQIWNQIQQIMK